MCQPFQNLSAGHHTWKNLYKPCNQHRKGLTITPEPAALPGAPAPLRPHSALGQGLSRLAPAQSPAGRNEQARNEQAFEGVKAVSFV